MAFAKRYLLFAILVAICVVQKSPGLALILGALYRVVLNKEEPPYPTPKWGKYGLQFAIVLLGFRLNIGALWATSVQYAGFMSASVVMTLLFGLWLGRRLDVDKKISTMTASGAAICGGSAIAAVASAIRANAAEIAVSLSIVLVLNAVAILAFPMIGHALEFSQEQFGVWAALAIHDTGSVVGAAETYGAEAAKIATTLKLGRALWIIPFTYYFSTQFNESASETEEDAGKAKLKVPVFIVCFVLASILGSLVANYEFWKAIQPVLKHSAKYSLVLSLFLIGTGMTRAALKNFRGKTLAQGLIVWLTTSIITCALVHQFV